LILIVPALSEQNYTSPPFNYFRRESWFYLHIIQIFHSSLTASIVLVYTFLPIFAMEPRSNWFNSTGFENKPLHSQGAAIVHTIDSDSDASALNIQIHAWPIDRDFHDDPFASPTEFYKAYFLHCNQVELGLEPTKAESHAKQPAHYVSQITASETTKEEACEQSRIKQVRQNG
jgi:hypothetical protein